MKTTLGKKTRLLALAALVAVLPLGIWACEDSGDGPDGPTGPATQYNPQIDYPDSTITAKVSTSPVAPGATFGVLATFKDANGLPVEGVPLAIVAEDGGARGYFTYQTNPTLTDGSGKASIGVVVSATCPQGSYRFMIAPLRGAQVRGYVGVKVSTSGGGAPASITGITVTPPASATQGLPAGFGAAVTATPGCDVYMHYRAYGAVPSTGWIDAPVGNPTGFNVTPASTGTLYVVVEAWCNATDPLVSITSSPVGVTVTAPTP